jgi:hypothetical protein
MDSRTPPGRNEPSEVGGQSPHVACSHCGRVLGFSDQRPLFCSFCGKPLPRSTEESTVAPAAGLDEVPTLTPVLPATGGSDAKPEVVGGYRLLRRLGAGGMGTVYEADDPAGGRHVAVKLIASGQELSRAAVERFRREGRLASAISHPRCVFVLAAEEDAGRPYIVMELMPGKTLADLLGERGPLPPGEAVAKILDVLAGLREAHRLGMVHRDVKPSNCFLEANGRVKIGDFGLSKSLVADSQLTETGTFLGTRLFASPEQVRGETLGPQSDVYSLAATLYCLLTGRAPFEGGDAVAIAARIASDPAPPLRPLRPEVPPGLEQAVLRGLERDRRSRWANLDEFEQALVPYSTGGQEAAPPELRFVAYLVDSIVLGALAFVVERLNLAATRSVTDELKGEISQGEMVQGIVTGFVLGLLYFVVQERLWGCTPGKRLLRMRVCTPGGTEPPGWGRVFVRYATFYVLTDLAALFLLVLPPAGPRVWLAHGNIAGDFSWIASIGVALLGVALLLTTMRPRNGWRGPHELLSGTRTALLAEATLHVFPAARPLDGTLVRPADLPERVGPFVVRGALRWGAGERVLLGEDPALSRPVLLWLRPVTDGPLSPARRESSSLARLRWLTGGEQSGWRWDAFPVPPGQSLADLVAQRGPLSWREFRPMLEQLVDELVASTDDRTLPERLAAGQVWVRPGGDVVLLDTSLQRDEGDPGHEVRSQPALQFAARAAVLALEGRPRPAAHQILARVPQHAARLLDRLFDEKKPYRNAQELRAALLATRSKPVEVTRGRRAAQIVALGVLQFVGLCGFMFPFVWIVGVLLPLDLLKQPEMERQGPLRQLEVGTARDFVAGVVAAPVLARPGVAYQLGADLELRDRLRDRLDRDERQLRERAEKAGWLTRGAVTTAEEIGEELEGLREEEEAQRPQGPKPAPERFVLGPNYRSVAKQRAETGVTSGFVYNGMLALLLNMLAFWCLLWVASAFLFRGGLTHYRMGLSLVRANGLRAGRLRCAWRALLVWGPLTAVLMGTARADFWYWTADIAANRLAWAAVLVEALRWTGLAMLVGYPVLAICYPRRAIHDWLAGTYLVPR